MPCTRGDICMGSSINKQGGFKFMTLGLMKKVARQRWDAIPMPDTVIERVNTLGQVQTNDIEFLDNNKHPIGEIKITGFYNG